MLKELMNHNFLGVKFFRDEAGKIYVSVEAIKRQIEIAKHYDECMAGTWRPEAEKKFNRI